MFKAMTGGRKMKMKLIGIWVLLVFFLLEYLVSAAQGKFASCFLS